jgi:hypothetical protein
LCPSTFDLALRIAFSTKSIPITLSPRDAKKIEVSPVPHPASSIGSTTWLAISMNGCFGLPISQTGEFPSS